MTDDPLPDLACSICGSEQDQPGDRSICLRIYEQWTSCGDDTYFGTGSDKKSSPNMYCWPDCFTAAMDVTFNVQSKRIAEDYKPGQG